MIAVTSKEKEVTSPEVELLKLKEEFLYQAYQLKKSNYFRKNSKDAFTFYTYILTNLDSNFMFIKSLTEVQDDLGIPVARLSKFLQNLQKWNLIYLVKYVHNFHRYIVIPVPWFMLDNSQVKSYLLNVIGMKPDDTERIDTIIKMRDEVLKTVVIKRNRKYKRKIESYIPVYKHDLPITFKNRNIDMSELFPSEKEMQEIKLEKQLRDKRIKYSKAIAKQTYLFLRFSLEVMYGNEEEYRPKLAKFLKDKRFKIRNCPLKYRRKIDTWDNEDLFYNLVVILQNYYPIIRRLLKEMNKDGQKVFYSMVKKELLSVLQILHKLGLIRNKDLSAYIYYVLTYFFGVEYLHSLETANQRIYEAFQLFYGIEPKELSKYFESNNRRNRKNNKIFKTAVSTALCLYEVREDEVEIKLPEKLDLDLKPGTKNDIEKSVLEYIQRLMVMEKKKIEEERKKLNLTNEIVEEKRKKLMNGENVEYNIAELEMMVKNTLKDKEINGAREQLRILMNEALDTFEKELNDIVKQDKLELDFDKPESSFIQTFLSALGNDEDTITKVVNDWEGEKIDTTISCRVEFRHVRDLLIKYRDILQPLLLHFPKEEKKRYMEKFKRKITKIFTKYKDKKEFHFTATEATIFVFDTEYLRSFKGNLPKSIVKLYSKLMKEHPKDFRGTEEDLLKYNEGIDYS